jgi:YebC/PmpR family DNA-binding regulatory protein
MSKVFPRLAKSITIAAKEGGPDPDMNPKLRAAIQTAKAQNLPKENIERAIQRATGKDADQIQEVHYEGRGPHGTMIIVECATDNNTRTVANIKSYFNKMGGEPLNKGALDFMFTRKTVIEFTKTDEMDLDEIELELIDAGLEEMEVEGDKVTLYAPFTSFGVLNKAVEDLGISPDKTTVQYIPNTTIELTEEQMEDVDKLIDRIEEDDDVQTVYTNIG